MAVPTAYLASTKNLAGILDAVQRAGVPERFTFEFLKQLGFPSSSDRPAISVLKSIGFLTDASVPTEKYRQFKDKNLAKAVLAQGIREGYADVFAIDTDAPGKTTQDLAGMFARISSKGEAVTVKMATTFKALCSHADFSAGVAATAPILPSKEVPPVDIPSDEVPNSAKDPIGHLLTLRHDIHVHLPLSTDVAVYDAIFKSLKANLT